MADAKGGLQFVERGVRLFLDVGLELGGIEFTPGAPTRFGGQGLGFGGGEVAVNRAPGDLQTTGRLHFGTARLHKLHHPLPQIQRVSFHTLTRSACVPMSMLNTIRNQIHEAQPVVVAVFDFEIHDHALRLKLPVHCPPIGNTNRALALHMNG